MICANLLQPHSDSGDKAETSTLVTTSATSVNTPTTAAPKPSWYQISLVLDRVFFVIYSLCTLIIFLFLIIKGYSS